MAHDVFQNDDGINPCNSQDVRITDCFIRSDDDCVALKGLSLNSPNNNVERITVEKCTLWCDRARIFLLGHESRAAFMRNVTLRNLDIIHFSMTRILVLYYSQTGQLTRAAQSMIVVLGSPSSIDAVTR